MSQSIQFEIENLLNSLANAWLSGRGSVLVKPVTPAQDSDSTMVLTGPGFFYQWSDGKESVRISVISEGSQLLERDEDARQLFIQLEDDTLYLHSASVGATGLQVTSEAALESWRRLSDPCSEDQSAACSNLIGMTTAQSLIPAALEALKGSSASKAPSTTPAKHRIVTDLHDWLAVELKNSVRLGDAAKYFKKSPRQLIRVLKETTGSGFAEHLTMHRLILARRLLMRTGTSIKEIAHESGFNSREQFIRSFSKAFGWTPLQFRKAWNKAALSNSHLGELCRISDRSEVAWQDLDHLPAKETFEGQPHTLVVANALHQIVELFSVQANGTRARAGLLDRGSMTFINRDTGGSRWLVRTPSGDFERGFTTPDGHATAVISPELHVAASKRAAG